MGLAARALEVSGIPTTLTSWSKGLVRLTMPPRATTTDLPRGSTVGAPGDTAQQRRVLLETLALLEQTAPLEPIHLNETAEE